MSILSAMDCDSGAGAAKWTLFSNDGTADTLVESFDSRDAALDALTRAVEKSLRETVFHRVEGTDGVFTSDGLCSFRGDIKRALASDSYPALEVVYPKQAAAKAAKELLLLPPVHAKHTDAVREWIAGWNTAQLSLPAAKRVTVCPYVKELPALPRIPTSFGIYEHLRKMNQDLAWIEENAPGLPAPMMTEVHIGAKDKITGKSKGEVRVMTVAKKVAAYVVDAPGVWKTAVPRPAAGVGAGAGSSS